MKPKRQRGLPVPPARPRTEVIILTAQSLLMTAAWAGCTNGVLAMPLPHWAAMTAAVLLGASLGLYLCVAWIIVAPRRFDHAQRWANDPEYRKQFGGTL